MNYDTVALLNANKLTQIAKDSLWKHENIKNNDMTSSNRPLFWSINLIFSLWLFNSTLYSTKNNNSCVFFLFKLCKFLKIRTGNIFKTKFFNFDFINDDTLKQFLFRNSSIYVGCNSFEMKQKSYVEFGKATNDDFKTGEDTCLLPCTISLIQLTLFSQRKPVSIFKNHKTQHGWLIIWGQTNIPWKNIILVVK